MPRKWRKNTSRENRLEELGRVDAEKAYTREGSRNLKDEKKRIVRELKATGGTVGKRKFGGGRQGKPTPEPKPKPQPQRRMEGKESLRDKLKWERWKIERKKQSDKPSTPLGGGIKKIGPKPGSMDYFLQETMKPGYKIPKKARGGLIKGKPKLAKRGWK